MARLLFTICVLLSSGIWLPCRATPSQLDGDWVGEFKIDGKAVYVRTHFETKEGNTAATFNMPLERPRRVVLQHLEFDSAGRIHFELPKESSSLLFDGQLRDGTISGEVRQGGTRGTFELLRLVPVNLELYKKYAGSYQFGKKFIDIGPFSENENRLRFFDSSTRRTGVLFALSDKEFFSGPSVGVAFPIQIRASFITNRQGQVTGVKWLESVSSKKEVPVNLSVGLIGKKVDANTEEEVTFHNGDVTLHGTLTIPAGNGLHPAMVLIPGSGPSRRPGGFWIPFFARHGIAMLVFDKRGAGESTGDWMKSTYHDLAADALAAVQLLKNHKGIDPKQIGLWGNSEGGWVAPLAASQSTDVAFLVVRSGSALPVWKTVLHEAEGQLRDGNGLSEDEIRAALALKQSVEGIALETKNWDEAWVTIDAAYQKARNERWFNQVAVTQKDIWWWQWWRLRGGYDPTPALEKIHCPVLVLLGEIDWPIPSKESAAAFERAFKKSGNRDYTIRILPKGTHGLLEGETGFDSEAPRLKKYVPGYMDGMASWLLKHLKVNN